ncbi:sigma-70 family RNA polymerase sigma factor [Sphingopyxis sp. P1IMeth2]|uniref:sigma-70 family RNA polymerase sigma factor n=1 Tax=Sphingopyxis sp. P1IMeth2 TaxID=1892848 RepID=UPI00164474FF|nr:sigma-70 family RNA polymerase sigma factor [Sphingopyxis sp. P1IMeth2]
MRRPPQPRPSSPPIDPAFVARVRGDLLRFARLQLGGDDEAEDAVQEALAAALRNGDQFRGEAALKTWVIAILKNKIADLLRQRRRRPLGASEMASEEEGGTLPALFDERGMWREAARPAAWEDPEAGLHSDQFLAIFDACLNRLPAQQGQVFLMREVVELATDEICDELGLTSGNIHVILHRARLALRACLQHHWFAEAVR